MNALSKIKTREELLTIRRRLAELKKSVVFTNGVFDILHRGHAEYLQKARGFGDVLIIGLNSDASVRRLKGSQRPLVPEEDRAFVLASLTAVDYVCLFAEDTPFELIRTLTPDVLVKGGDYQLHQIAGREIVENRGGRVLTIPLTPNRSTTNIVQKIIDLTKQGAFN